MENEELAPNGSPGLGGDGGNSRISSSLYWIFTFNNYSIHYKNGLDSFATLLGEYGLYVFQEEIGDEGTPHLQGSFKFHKKGRPMETFRIHTEDGKYALRWQKCKKWSASVTYCTKLESRSGKVYTNIPDLDIPEKLEVEEPYGWQLEVMDIFKEKPDKRKIYWYWSDKGNIGKTSLAKYICATKKHSIFVNGKASDMKCAIAKMETKPKIVILGFPKTLDHQYISYSGIEEIKDGMFFSGKYESDMVLFNNPHVIIFCNQPPDEDKLSKDRLVVKKIVLDT